MGFRIKKGRLTLKMKVKGMNYRDGRKLVGLKKWKCCKNELEDIWGWNHTQEKCVGFEGILELKERIINNSE